MRRCAIFAFFLLAIGAIPAHAREKPWIEVRSPHFRVLTNGSQNDARHLAKEFEQMRYVFADRYPEFRLEGGAPLTIFAALDEPTARALDPAAWKSKGAKPAGVFHHGWEKQYVIVQLDAMGDEGARQIVYHEYSHTIFHLNFHWLPTWLDEGLANFYGFSRFEEHKIHVGAPPARYQMPRGSLIPVETLINITSPFSLAEDQVHLFYSESWALVHFLMFDPGMERGKRLNQFVGLLQQGVEQKKAFQQAFGSFKDMDRALADYLTKVNFQTGVLPDSTQIDEKSFSLRTMSLAETEAELAGFHLWTHDPQGARHLIEEALKDDPKLGLAHEDMGFLMFSEGKDAEALNEFSQANSIDPTLALSLFAKTVLSPIATSDVPADQSAFHDALLKVLALNPQFAPAYVQLARLSVRKNDLITALALSRKAEQLEPALAGYHVQSGQILLRMGRGSEAASFARFVAQRWPASDHDEAVELWNAIPPEQRPAGDALSIVVPKDVQSVEGTVKSVSCSGSERNMSLVLYHDGQTLTFRGRGDFPGGFSDTIWYGVDHFSFCHHLEGLRAIVRYRSASDGSYAGDLAEIDIRDDLPERPSKLHPR